MSTILITHFVIKFVLFSVYNSSNNVNCGWYNVTTVSITWEPPSLAFVMIFHLWISLCSSTCAWPIVKTMRCSPGVTIKSYDWNKLKSGWLTWSSNNHTTELKLIKLRISISMSEYLTIHWTLVDLITLMFRKHVPDCLADSCNYSCYSIRMIASRTHLYNEDENRNP